MKVVELQKKEIPAPDSRSQISHSFNPELCGNEQLGRIVTYSGAISRTTVPEKTSLMAEFSDT